MGLRAKTTFFALLVILAVSVDGERSAMAACYTADQQLPAQTVNDFMGSPRQMLQDPKNAAGGADMIALVRDLVASNPATLPVIIGLLANASSGQQTAIGTGLGQAAGLCIRPDATFAGDIQAQLAASTSDAAKGAYAAVTGNFPIRSVAGGGGVSGGSSGGSTSGSASATQSGNSTFTPFSPNSTSGTPTNYLSASTTSASTSTPLGTTAATSVSP